VQLENQQQAADQVSISNSIRSLRFLGAADWRAFVEEHSIVERILREDPTGDYARMDFASRDAYRHVVETTAKRSSVEEGAVAERAIGLARAAAAGAAPDARTTHVGFYLVEAQLPVITNIGASELFISVDGQESNRTQILIEP
jgi:hypothetical protein